MPIHPPDQPCPPNQRASGPPPPPPSEVAAWNNSINPSSRSSVSTLHATDTITVIIIYGCTRIVLSRPHADNVTNIRMIVKGIFQVPEVRFFATILSQDSSQNDVLGVKCKFFPGEVVPEGQTLCKVHLPTKGGEMSITCPIEADTSRRDVSNITDWYNAEGGRSWDDSLVLYVLSHPLEDHQQGAEPTPVYPVLQRPSEWAVMSDQLAHYVKRLQPSPSAV